ncbi:MFS transporter [Amycolatopsis sp. K13G38]|uniref:MFS transporter n=1 Tax=Amycolatopsis acididurans TaxID=2724524 RepID=A0ABX1J115_9PSEU|nr:MFS transporter [Amycolatopsis acididurans]NKQ52674.1 MFS transporter [Amycolatopsis acididurans]
MHKPAERAGAAAPGAVVGVLAFSGIVVALMQTLVIPLVPELPKLLHASSSDTAWAITATLLAGAVSTPVLGRLGDMYGKRRMLLLCLVLLIAGSATAGLSDSLTPIVIGRALQGLASPVIPLGISIMRDVLPPERLGGATALMSASLGVGGALGLPAAALLAENLDWHMLFWVSAALGVAALVLTITLVPGSPKAAAARFDFAGAAGLSAALVALLLAISKGASWGWGSGLTLGLFGGAIVVLLLWGWYELRTKQPLVDLRTTARRQVLLTNIASAVFGFAMFAMSLVLPQLLQLPAATGYGLGQTMLVAGLVMAPSGLVMMIVSPVSARVSRAYGPKVTLMIGALIVGIAYALGIVLMGAVWQVVIISCLIGVGIGLSYGSLPALIMGAVPVTETAAANSLNMLMRSIGTSVSSAVAGVVLAQMTVSLGPATVPAQSGFRVVLAIASGAAILAFIVAGFLPKQRRASAAAPAAATVPEPAPEPVRAGEIAGWLRSAGGGSVPGAVVTVTGPDGHQIERVHADETGGYRVAGLGSGTYTVIVTATGFQPDAATVSINGVGAVHDVALTGRGLLTGAVEAGATVTATTREGEVIGTTVAGEDGTFRLAGLPAGQITVVATLPGREPAAATVLVGDEPASIELSLRLAGRLSGTVTDPDGRGLPHATVTLTDAGGVAVASTTTGASGEYTVDGLLPGAYTLTTAHYQPVVREVALTGADQFTVDFDLQRQPG